MKVIQILFLTFSSFIGFAQSNGAKILTENENKEWIANFESLTNIEQKLDSIKHKINRETIYIVSKQACSVVISNPKFRKTEHRQYECKIPFFLVLNKRYYLLDPVENIHAEKLIDLIRAEHIENFEYQDPGLAIVYYGSGGMCGAILIHSKSKDLKKLLKLKVP